MLFKNVASQKIHVYAYDSTTGASKTGDAANITAYVSLDGTANAIDDTNPTEVDATNMPGVYVFDLAQAETNCNSFALYAKSATSNIRIEPIIGFTTGAANALSVTTGVNSDKSGYALTATTGLGNQTANITGNLSGSVGSVTGAVGSVTGAVGSVTAGVTVTTNNDKSGYSLTAGTGLGNQTANITGTVSGNSTHSAADVKTAIEAAGSHLTLVLADTDELQKAITDGGRTDLLIDAIKAKTDAMPSAATISTQVASDLAAAHGAGSWATATGFSTHSAADVVTALGTGSTLTALATAANLAAAKAILDKFNTMVVLDGAVYDFTSDALAAAPGGTGSDPLSSAVPGAYAAGTAGYVIGTYLDAAISGVGGAVGSGADSVTVTWTSEGNPVADGDVWVATDAAGTNVVAGTLQTDGNGQATFQLDAGSTYYFFGQKDGVNSIRGERFVAVAD